MTNMKLRVLTGLALLACATTAIPFPTEGLNSIFVPSSQKRVVVNDAQDIINKLNNDMQVAYNSQNFTGMAYNLCFPGVGIIPADTTEFGGQDTVEAFFRALFKGGDVTASFSSVAVVQASEQVIHTIGNFTGSINTARFYARVVLGSDGQWRFAFLITTLALPNQQSSKIGGGGSGIGNGLSRTHNAAPNPQDIISARGARFSELFNSQNFDGLAQEMYNLGSFLIPFTSDSFIAQPNLSNFWQQTYNSGVRNLTLKYVNLYQESETLIHEIGYVSLTTGGQQGGGYYYSRWAYEDTRGTWQLSFDVGGIAVDSQ